MGRAAPLREPPQADAARALLRGAARPDIEGFVGFIRDQQAVGASQLEAVSEEEGADAVRLLTIHAAKGLEFKVVIVADAGRDTGGAPSSDEILGAPDGTFGFRVIDPKSGKKRGVFGYEEVREAEKREDDGRAAAPLLRRDDACDRPADRLRRDRPRAQQDRETPIGWVLARLDCDGELDGAASRSSSSAATHVPRCASTGAAPSRPPSRRQPTRRGGPARAVRRAADGAARRAGTGCRSSPPLPPPPLHRVRRLSYSALALFERCSYRYYAERVAGLREERGTCRARWRADGDRDRRRGAPPARGGRPSRAGRAGRVESSGRGTPAVTDDELARIDALRRALLRIGARGADRDARGRAPERPFAFEHDGVLLHGRLDVLWRDGPRALVLDYKTNTLAEGTPEEIVEADYRLQRLVYALACFRAGADEVEVVYHFLERPDAVVSTSFDRVELPALEAELSAAIRRIDAGEFVATPSDFTCAGCPALDLVCAGPNLRQPPGRLVAAA